MPEWIIPALKFLFLPLAFLLLASVIIRAKRIKQQTKDNPDPANVARSLLNIFVTGFIIMLVFVAIAAFILLNAG